MVKTEDRIYQAYYTKSTPIVDYMLNRLEVKHSDAILEPCGGDGVFVDALLQQNKNVSIDVYELNGESVEVLMEKFETFNNVTIYHADTLLDDN